MQQRLWHTSPSVHAAVAQEGRDGTHQSCFLCALPQSGLPNVHSSAKLIIMKQRFQESGGTRRLTYRQGPFSSHPAMSKATPNGRLCGSRGRVSEKPAIHERLNTDYEIEQSASICKLLPLVAEAIKEQTYWLPSWTAKDQALLKSQKPVTGCFPEEMLSTKRTSGRRSVSPWSPPRLLQSAGPDHRVTACTTLPSSAHYK